MELPSLDLNLVIVLHALLEEQNVTRAGERVGLSQPGTSAALARLRRHFNDPLLERVGNRYHLTPMAQALSTEVSRTVRDLQRLLTAQPDFDPTALERRFVITCSDAVLAVLGARVIAAVGRVAPGVSFDFRPLTNRGIQDPLGLLRDVDLLIFPRGLFSIPDAVGAEVYRDRWICATWSGNTSIGNELSFAELQHARWVMPFQQLLNASPADAALSALGIDRSCAVRVESFSVLDRLVVGTNLLVLLHERLIDNLGGHQLRAVKLPVDLPEITEVVWTHPSRRLDAGLRWLLDLLVVEGRALTPSGPHDRVD